MLKSTTANFKIHKCGGTSFCLFVCLSRNTLENPYSEDYSVILREELHSVGQHFSSLAAYSVWTTGYVRRLYAAGG